MTSKSVCLLVWLIYTCLTKHESAFVCYEHHMSLYLRFGLLQFAFFRVKQSVTVTKRVSKSRYSQRSRRIFKKSLHDPPVGFLDYLKGCFQK